MCGIYGSTKFYNEATIAKKLQLIAFRGPDHSAFEKINNKVILGHNRLAIIDLDSRSNQPFNYQHVTVVFNGEIYNFLDLRKTLKKEGFEFKTNSDTEVLCAAYIHFGFDCVKHFIGMFAFTIYDSRRNLLFGARDRLGQKPFYYSLKDNHFEFSSQVYQITNGNKFEIDDSSVHQYLQWGDIIEPKSIYKDLYKLKAGHSFTYDLETREFFTQKYWDIDEYENFTSNYENAKDELDRLLNDAVKIRMIADVPLGVFLSGGIDSSLIASIAQANSTQKIKTFSVKFDEAEFDESQYATQIANHLGTDHRIIECSVNEGIDLIKDLSNYYQEPFADSSAIPTSLLSRYTREFVTVALSGDAGDETFIGYNHYDKILKAKKLFYFPKGIRKTIAALLRLINRKKFSPIISGIILNDINELFMQKMCGNNNAWLEAADNFNNEYEKWLYSDKNILERTSDFDIKVFLNSDINTKVDRASMAYSLETRAPLEDHRIIAFGRSLPTSFKYTKGKKKKILKDVLSRYVPEKLFDRPKMGFGVPIKSWFRHEMKDYISDIITLQNLNNFPQIKSDQVLRMLSEHISGTHNHSRVLYRILILINWFKMNKLS